MRCGSQYSVMLVESVYFTIDSRITCKRDCNMKHSTLSHRKMIECTINISNALAVVTQKYGGLMKKKTDNDIWILSSNTFHNENILKGTDIDSLVNLENKQFFTLSFASY